MKRKKSPDSNQKAIFALLLLLFGAFAFWVGDKIIVPGSFWLWVLGIGVGIIIFLFLAFIFLLAISGFNHYFRPE